MPAVKQTPSVGGVDWSDIGRRIAGFLIEGVAVAAAAVLIPQLMGGKMPPLPQILMIALVAASTFAVLDYGSPAIAGGARQGAGFGLGARMVGFP